MAKPSRRHHKRPLFYQDQLDELQVGLVQMHRHLIAKRRRVLVIFEGRDAAGKDGAIKHIVEHLSPRDPCRCPGQALRPARERVVLPRYVPYLPGVGEFVLINRSWYNRAGLERVMGYCNEAEARAFLNNVVPFEKMLVDSGLQLIKYYLGISRQEQRRRPKKRESDPLTQWKVSPVDQAATRKWDKYSRARDEMLAATNNAAAPWTVARTDDKREARLNIIRDLLRRIDHLGQGGHVAPPDPAVVFDYRPGLRGRLAP